MFLLPVAMFFQVVAIPYQVITTLVAVEEVPAVTVVATKRATPTRPRKIPPTKTYTAKVPDVQMVATQPNILDIIPRIKAYEVPGEKHQMILSLRCPTELVGVSTPASAALHKAIDAGFGTVNLMPFMPYTFNQACN